MRALRSLVGGLGVAAAALLATNSQASAVPRRFEPQDFTLDAGVVCAFPLRVQGNEVGNVTTREVPWGMVTSGRGPNLTFTNQSTGKAITLPSNGGSIRLRDNGDGTASYDSSGHIVTLQVPGDVNGPSATLIVGSSKVTLILDTFVFVAETRRGRTTDLCAAIA